MKKIIHLEEFVFAKKVTTDFPDVIKTIDNCYQQLYNYKEYIDVSKIIQQLDESKCMMELTLEIYIQVLKETKGDNDE